MTTQLLHVDPGLPDADTISRAAACLCRGGLVAFPTETVYGLGVHALDREAVLRLFAAKRRPANDPLIVHVPTIDAASALVESIPATARALADRFWPGPLTLVLSRSRIVPDEVTAGLDTVAIRVPAHPVARALIAAAGIPIAAPSANLFSRPSPTTAAHVLADLDGRIDMVVDAGPTSVGVESTVIDLSQASPTILRPGAIGAEAIRRVVANLGTTWTGAASSSERPRSPGLLSKHYAPHATLTLYQGAGLAAVDAMVAEARAQLGAGKRVAVLMYVEDRNRFEDLSVLTVDLGSVADPSGIARALYAALRRCDDENADVALVRAPLTSHELTPAIADRLRRAAARIVDVSS